jgi:hypothetical protein
MLLWALAAQELPAKKPEPFSVTFTGEIDPGASAVVGKLATIFYDSYPPLVKRFEHPDRPAPRHVTVVFKRPLRVPAYCAGDTITVSADWLKKNPDDVGLLTHELTHAVQRYEGDGPGWFTEGLADYTRKVYGPKEQPGWALPAKLTAKQSYTNSYRVTGRFLQWLEDKHPGTVDKLHRRRQDREFELADFKTFTGKTADELWADCVADLGKTP